MSPFVCFDCLHRNGQNKAELQGDTAHPSLALTRNQHETSLLLGSSSQDTGEKQSFFIFFLFFFPAERTTGQGTSSTSLQDFPQREWQGLAWSKVPEQVGKGRKCGMGRAGKVCQG